MHTYPKETMRLCDGCNRSSKPQQRFFLSTEYGKKWVKMMNQAKRTQRPYRTKSHFWLLSCMRRKEHSHFALEKNPEPERRYSLPASWFPIAPGQESSDRPAVSGLYYVGFFFRIKLIADIKTKAASDCILQWPHQCQKVVMHFPG